MNRKMTQLVGLKFLSSKILQTRDKEIASNSRGENLFSTHIQKVTFEIDEI
jgi:hypothetical protein